MHVAITHVYICSKTGCTARKMAFFITSQDRQTKVIARQPPQLSIKMYDFRDHCSTAKCSAVCNYPSNNVTVKHYLGTIILLQLKTNQSSIYQHGEYGLPTPNLVFERETYMAYNLLKCRISVIILIGNVFYCFCL